MEKQLINYLDNVSCLVIFTLPFEERCNMSRSVPACKHFSHIINYFEIMYCTSFRGSAVNALKIIFMFIIGLSFLLTGMITKFYLQPIMSLIAFNLKMTEYLAGITVLTYVNSFPDLLSNMLSIRTKSALYSIAASNSIVDVLLVGGLVCFLKPFKMDSSAVVRDLLFLALAIELTYYMIIEHSTVSAAECIFLLIFYFVYLGVQISDLFLRRSNIKALQDDIARLKQQPITDQRNKIIKMKLADLIKLQKHDVFGSKKSGEDNMTLDTHHQNLQRHTKMRSILYSRDTSKNRFLIIDFFYMINPIDIVDWQRSGCMFRTIKVIKAPMLVFIKLMVPQIDRETPKHGWSKLLNCLQIVSVPFLIITALHSVITNEHKSWYIVTNISYSKWTLFVTVPLALFVFIDTRTDMPPSYHITFLFLSIPCALVIIFLCVEEIAVLCEILGEKVGLSPEFIEITIGVLTSSMLDAYTIIGTTIQGYEEMAFAAVFAGPFFYVVVSLAIPILFNKHARIRGSNRWLIGDHGDTSTVFFTVVTFTLLLWMLTFDFNARRSYAIFCWSLLVVYYIFAILCEFNYIHSLSDDPVYKVI